MGIERTEEDQRMGWGVLDALRNGMGVHESGWSRWSAVGWDRTVEGGLEWNGMEWNGMEWNGVEWDKAVRSGMETKGMEW